jgi:hypothetical protein
MSRTLPFAVFAVLAFAWPAMADGQFWVTGNTNAGCRIVNANPVVDFAPGSFASGPYKSEDDAKLAMKGIPACQRQ